MIFIFVSLILMLLWVMFRKNIFGKILGILWLSIFSLILLSYILDGFFSTKYLNQNDIRGEYVIDRDMFPGKQADWQYNHYRFEITDDNKFLFHITNGKKIITTIEGKASFTDFARRISLTFGAPKLKPSFIASCNTCNILGGACPRMAGPQLPT